MKINYLLSIILTMFIIASNSTVTAQMPEPKYLTVQNTQICYYEKGTGDILLLLHGWPQTSYVWRKVFPELSENNRVIALDLPGLGDSDEVTQYDVRFIASLIKSFLDELHIKQVHLIGHDVGAWVAVSFALNQSEMLNSLTILEAGIPGLMNPEVFQPENAEKVWQFYFHAIKDIPEILVAGKEREYLNWYFTNKSVVKSAISEEDLDVYYEAYKSTKNLTAGFEYYRAFVKSAEQNKKDSYKLKIPVLGIGGESALNYQVGNALKNISNEVKILSIQECGHYIPEEQPEILIEHLNNFLSLEK